MSQENPQYRVNEEIWGAGQNVVRYRPSLAHCHDKPDGTKYRGAQVMSIDGGNMTLRILLEPSFVGERTVARSLAPNAIIGDGVVCRVTGQGADSYVVAEVLDGKPTCPSDQAVRVARGEFHPAAIPDELY